MNEALRSISRPAERNRTSGPRAFTAGLSDSVQRFLPLLIFILSLAYLCLFLRFTTMEPDEGIVLRGAERILSGQLPYRDFFSFYTPGSFYLLAWLFRLFGDSFIVARLSVAVAGAVCSAITYILARRVCPVGISLFVAILATTTGAAFRFLVLHNVYSTLGCCLSLYAAVRWIETQRLRWAFAVGSLASITFLIEQSKGAGLYLGLSLAILILMFRNSGVRFSGRGLTALTSGLGWPLLTTFAYFAAHHSLALMLRSWLWPLQHYTQANHVPYGYQNWSDRTRDIIFHSGPAGVRVIKVLAVCPGLLVPLLPLISLAILAYWICAAKRPDDPNSRRHYILVASVLAGLLVSVVCVRADVLHFMYLVPLWYLVLAWILGSPNFDNRLLVASRAPLLFFVAASFGLLAMAVLSASAGARNRIETRRGVVFTASADEVVSYVQSHISRGENLLVYPYLPLYNYLTDTRNPGRYDFFQPGMNTSHQAQEMIRSLQMSASPVLFEPQFEEKIAQSWPRTSLAVFATDPVSDFIARNYRVCRNLTSPEGWRFEFMVRKERSCP